MFSEGGLFFGFVAQSAERPAVNRKVAGSSPAVSAAARRKKIILQGRTESGTSFVLLQASYNGQYAGFPSRRCGFESRRLLVLSGCSSAGTERWPYKPCVGSSNLLIPIRRPAAGVSYPVHAVNLMSAAVVAGSSSLELRKSSRSERGGCEVIVRTKSPAQRPRDRSVQVRPRDARPAARAADIRHIRPGSAVLRGTALQRRS